MRPVALVALVYRERMKELKCQNNKRVCTQISGHSVRKPKHILSTVHSEHTQYCVSQSAITFNSIFIIIDTDNNKSPDCSVPSLNWYRAPFSVSLASIYEYAFRTQAYNHFHSNYEKMCIFRRKSNTKFDNLIANIKEMAELHCWIAYIVTTQLCDESGDFFPLIHFRVYVVRVYKQMKKEVKRGSHQSISHTSNHYFLNSKMTHFYERRFQAKIVLHNNDTVLRNSVRCEWVWGHRGSITTVGFFFSENANEIIFFDFFLLRTSSFVILNFNLIFLCFFCKCSSLHVR